MKPLIIPRANVLMPLLQAPILQNHVWVILIFNLLIILLNLYELLMFQQLLCGGYSLVFSCLSNLKLVFSFNLIKESHKLCRNVFLTAMLLNNSFFLQILPLKLTLSTIVILLLILLLGQYDLLQDSLFMRPVTKLSSLILGKLFHHFLIFFSVFLTITKLISTFQSSK